MWLGDIGDIGSLNGDFSIGEMEKFFLPGSLRQTKQYCVQTACGFTQVLRSNTSSQILSTALTATVTY